MLHRIYQQLPPRTADCFTPENLLGPVAAERIPDPAVAAFLFNPETAAFRAVTDGASIVLGRRGAGKSALIKAFLEPQSVRDSASALFAESAATRALLQGANDFNDENQIVIWVSAPYEMAEVDRIVRATKFYSVEMCADAWRQRLWLNVVKRFIEDEKARRLLPAKLRGVYRSLAELNDAEAIGPLKIALVPKLIQRVRANRATLIDETAAALSAAKCGVLFLVDTIEEYSIREAAVENIVSGLFYLAGGNNPAVSGCKFKIALPTEIYRIIENAGAPGKQAPATEFIQWNAVALERIAAHRLLIFAALHCPEFYADIEPQLRTRSQFDKALIRSLWQHALGSSTLNEAGAPESPINYVLRHTLLVPRQVIYTLAFAVHAQHRETGQYLPVGRRALEAALDRGAETIAREVFTSYKHVYPQVSQVMEKLLGHCDSEMSYGDLHKLYNREVHRQYPHDYCDDFPSFLRAIIDCGIFGIRVKESERAVEGRFAYNYGGRITFNEKDVILMHPAFCRQYLNPSRRIAPRRAIMAFRALEDEA
jgi:hypothetical protein